MSVFDPATPLLRRTLPRPVDFLSARCVLDEKSTIGDAISDWTVAETVGAFLSLAVFAILAQMAWTANGMVVPWDSKNHFYPMFRFLGEALSRGEIPLWNPYHFAGHPSVADPQSLLFSPTMLLFAWLAPHASMAVFDGVIFAHLFAGGAGLMLLMRRHGAHPAGAVIAAMIFMIGGPACSRLQHTGMIISYSLFPLALVTLDIALAKRSWVFAFLFGVSAALMALGRDQVAFLFCSVLLGSVILRFAMATRPLAWLRERIALLVAMGFVGAAIIIVPALLTMQFLGTSNRPGISFGVAAAGSLAPVNFITLLAPNFFGSLNWTYDYWGPGYETMTDADWTDRAVNYLFIGTVPMLLLAWKGIGAGWLLRKDVRPALLLGILSALYAVGRYTPFFGWVFDAIPGVELYRRPADATFLLNVSLALASGFLLSRYVRTGLPKVPASLLRLVRTGTALLLLAMLAGSALSFSANGTHFYESLASLALAFAIAVAAALLLFKADCGAMQYRYKRRTLVAVFLVMCTGAELVWRNAGSSINAEPASRYAVYNGLSAGDMAGLDLLRQDISTKFEQGEHPRVEILGLGGAWQNASMVFGLENLLGYNPLRIADYERAVGPGENANDPNLRHFPGTFRGYKCRLATLLGLEYLVLDRPMAKLPRHFPRPATATPLYTSDTMNIYRLGKSAPRAYLAAAVKPVETASILDDETLPDFDRSQEVLVEKADMESLTGNYPLEAKDNINSHIAIAAYHDNSVVIEVDTDHAGIVVLHDLYYPGWQVTVDGSLKPLIKANILFRGVEVSEGHHIVEFSFHPFSLENLMAAAHAGLAGRGDE